MKVVDCCLLFGRLVWLLLVLVLFVSVFAGVWRMSLLLRRVVCLGLKMAGNLLRFVY
jgi:hypothetical protein